MENNKVGFAKFGKNFQEKLCELILKDRIYCDQIMEVLSKAKRTIIVENNYSGQFARYLRSETGFAADGHIRKYDGEPFMPHHIVDGVQAQVGGETDKYVPYQEITV